MVKLVYKPPTGEPWFKEVPEAQAKKMLKLGSWKRTEGQRENKKSEKTHSK